LEAGELRVAVDLDDLTAPLSPAGRGGSAGGTRDAAASAVDVTSNVAALRLSRARTVASSLDLRGARVEEALETLSRYLDDAGLAGLRSVVIIHGSGTGALRDAVRQAAGAHPLVASVRAGERGEGGDGATIVSF
jgi:dsDNA-specific endonuclease/ATPase MutS2